MHRGVFNTCQISRMEGFAEIVNGFQPLTAIAKRSILDVWQGYECKSDTGSSHFIPELSLDT